MKREELEQLAQDPMRPENAGAAARVYADRSLWPEFERTLYPNARATDEELEVVRRVVAERCGDRARDLAARLDAFVARRLARMAGDMGDFALAAASGARRASAAGADDEEPVTFVFVSESVESETDKTLAWRAELTLPPDAGAGTMLAVVLTDGAGAAIGGGFFRVAGATLPVANGRAEIPYGLFLSGLKDARVERTTPEGVRIPGTLALF